MAKQLWGELYIDQDGKAHFVCHTPPERSFEEVKAGLKKFVALLQDQLDREQECPHKT